MKTKASLLFSTGIFIFVLVGLSAVLRFILTGLLQSESEMIRWIAIISIIGLGAYIILKTAKVIEETTAVLKDKTALAGGLLQSLGTAFPDMVIGVTAALMGLAAKSENEVLAVSYAIIAASTTFGSNIYNIGHAAWCIYRQNTANRKRKPVLMFPVIGGGKVQPLNMHENKPYIIEFNTAIKILMSLSLLTVVIALAMVFFGSVPTPVGMTGDLYQLKREVGLVILILSVFVLYFFRHKYGTRTEKEENPFASQATVVIWGFLSVAGVAILLTAESMVEAIRVGSEMLDLSVVIAGVAAGMIGCLGEMIVVHNFTVHPRGRLGDAVVGVAMDNIVTIMGASLVAVLGGIFLGGASLITIFVLILGLNTILIWQISELKDEYIEEEHLKAHLGS